MSVRILRITLFAGLLLVSCSRRETAPSLVQMPPPLRMNDIHEGMSAKQVQQLLGKPIRVVHEPQNNLEAWTYLEHEENLKPRMQIGGVTIVFKQGTVTKVMPIYVNHQSR